MLNLDVPVPDPSSAQLFIYSISGKLYHEAQGPTTLLPNDMTPGIYLIRVLADGKTWQKKLIVR